MRVTVAIHLIDTEGCENENRQRVSPQGIHPQRDNEHDFRGAMSQQIQRREEPIAVRQSLRCTQNVDSNEIVRIAREFVLSEDPDNRVQGRGMNEPEQQASDGFKHTVDSLECNARPKRTLNDGPGSRRHKRIIGWVSKACFSNQVQRHFELMPSIDGLS